MTRTGGQVLADQLELNGVDAAFCVPGESYLALLDALHDSPIRLYACRHEAAAANMAEAYGKLTGRPGICLVTRGPGSTHASTGVHTANQDSTPMILLVGQVPRRLLGREAFQEIDYAQMFGGLAKWAAQIHAPERIPEHVARAFAVAVQGRPGPVVLALPEDVLAEPVDVPDAEPVRDLPHASPRPDDLRTLDAELRRAERPIVIVGEGGWNRSAADLVLELAERLDLPVAASFRCQDYVDNRSRVYAGHLTIGTDTSLARRVEEADLILAIGGRLGDVPTRGFTLISQQQRLVHVHPDPAELGRNYQPVLGIPCAPADFALAMQDAAIGPDHPPWADRTAQAHADYEASLQHTPTGRNVDLGDVMAFLRRRLPADAVLTCGAGNFTVWAHRFYEFRQYGTQLAPRSGAMGYGIPAALAAKVLHPQRIVVCIAGDGDFMMSGAELATAVQYELPIVILIVNNGMYGTIRMHQERIYPGRVVATDLRNPDFAAYAESFGAHGETIERTEEVEDAFERAVESGRPAVLDLRVDPEAISPRHTISELREAAR